MGYWKNKFDQVAKKALVEYGKAYGVDPEKVTLLMQLETSNKFLTGEVHFWTMVGHQPKEQVKFLHIYHGRKAKFDCTGMTYVIPKFICKFMIRLAQENSLDAGEIHLQVKLNQEEIFVFLMNGQKMIKLLGEDETFDDEQIAADQLQEAM